MCYVYHRASILTIRVKPATLAPTYRPVGNQSKKGNLHEHHRQSQTQSHPHGIVYRRPHGRAGHRHRRARAAGAPSRLRRGRPHPRLDLHDLCAVQPDRHAPDGETVRQDGTAHDLRARRRPLRSRLAGCRALAELRGAPDRPGHAGVRRRRHLPGRQRGDRRHFPARETRWRARPDRRCVRAGLPDRPDLGRRAAGAIRLAVALPDQPADCRRSSSSWPWRRCPRPGLRYAAPSTGSA